MSDLSQDELTVLLIAARGEPMIPIGRWKAPTESLIARGYLKPSQSVGDPTGQFNNRITALGQRIASKADSPDASGMQDVQAVSSSLQRIHTKLRKDAEAIAVQMVDLANASSKVTGDSPREALEKWAKIIGKRALELVGGH